MAKDNEKKDKDDKKKANEKKDGEKLPFSIKKTDKKELKLKLKKNIQKLADKFSWQKFLTRLLTNKKVLILMVAVILGGTIFLLQMYDSNSKYNSSYQNEAIIKEKIPGQEEQHKETKNKKLSDKQESQVKKELKTENKERNREENKGINREEGLKQKEEQDSSFKSKETIQQSGSRFQFNSPVKGAEIGREYGWSKHPLLEDWRFHQGVDLLASQSTPIRAAAGGKVEQIKEDDYLGLVLILDHANGYQTVYGHAQKIYLEKGQQIKSGQAIGEVGNSGLVEQPTLHFEIWKDKETVKPTEYLNL